MRAIEVCGLTKRYGDTLAVDDLSFAVERGELFALLGVNGAGKTTTIRMLTGLTKPDAGDARLMGRSLRTELNEVKRLAGISPQESAVARRLSVRENLELTARLHDMNRREARARAAEMLQEFGLQEVADRRASALSGGWQRRLSIAMALVSRPELLFLDEPTLGLDVLARRSLWQMIDGLRGRVTIVLTTHSMEEAGGVSDRVCILNAGRAAAVGTPQELMERAGASKFEDAFVALAAPAKEEI